MLPPGHIAAGFLTAEAVVKFSHTQLTGPQIHQLYAWGAFFGFAPDLDYFLAFVKERAWVIKDLEANNHRRFISHAPVIWLLAGLLIYFFAQSQFFKLFGLIVWLGSWSHFILDTIEYGIMWLWPLSTKRYYLKFRAESLNDDKNFWRYWWTAVKKYTYEVSFYLEIILIIAAIFQFYKLFVK